MSRGSRFSTIVTWNWRGSSRTAKADRIVVTIHTAASGGVSITVAMRGLDWAIAREIAEPAEHAPHHKGPDRQERHQLDQGFGGDRQDQAVLMLGGIDAARAESHREGGEQRGDGEEEQR